MLSILVEKSESETRMMVKWGYTSLTTVNRYCQVVDCYDAVETHKRYSPVDRLRVKY